MCGVYELATQGIHNTVIHLSPLRPIGFATPSTDGRYADDAPVYRHDVI